MKPLFTFAQVEAGQSAARDAIQTMTRQQMTLFAPDLYRQLGLGFLLGAALVAGLNADDWAAAVASPAQAAELAKAPVPDPEFRIAPAN